MKLKWCVAGFLMLLLCAGNRLHAEQSDTNSVENIKAKAERGDVAAQYNLGAVYYQGQGVVRDYTEAVKWFSKSAEQNYAAAQYNLGVCYRDGQGVTTDLAEAVMWFRKAAEQNLALAEYNLGVCYGAGQGVATDAVAAVKWYRKASEQNLANAQSNLGACYEHGDGVATDATEAVKWYRKAADQNYAIAQYNLGYCYASGTGVATDAAEAAKWYRKAADQNYAIAQCNLGLCYATGQGVAKDATEAVKWFRKAANQNDSDAQYDMGDCYVNGNGVTKDYVEAYRWFNLASAQGDEDAKKALIRIESRMTPQQIAEAQRLSREFATLPQANPNGQSVDSVKNNPGGDVKPVSAVLAPVQRQPKTDSQGHVIAPEDVEWLKSQGIDPSTVTLVPPEQTSATKQPTVASATPPDLKGAMVWLDSFMGATNTVIAADVISMKPEALKFRLFDKDYNYSGHYTVLLNAPRQHKNPYLGLGSPETANFVILENVGGNSMPLQAATIWEKRDGFIDAVALSKEWIHSGTYTIQH